MEKVVWQYMPSVILKLFKSYLQCRNKFYEINQGSLQNAGILTLALICPSYKYGKFKFRQY